MIYRYSQEAMDRIAGLGQTALAEFIEEIPQRLRRTVYDRMLRVQGFRPGSQAEFNEKQRRLIGHLIHPLPSHKETVDWKSFSFLWETWARERFGETFPKGNDTELAPDTGPAFLQKLAECHPDAAREDVERLFIFSPFPDHPDTEVALARFRPAAVIARDQLIDGLPVRLQGIEARVGTAEIATADAGKRFERLESSSASLHNDVGNLARGISRNFGVISELQFALDAESARVSKLEKIIDALNTAGERAANAITVGYARTDAVERSVRALEARGDEWDKVAATAEVLKAAVAGFSSHEGDWTGTAEAIGMLEKRIAALEGGPALGAIAPGRRRRVRLLEKRPEGPFVDIFSVSSACHSVASNLEAVGVKKGAAFATARQTVAALIAGQMVQFSGSLADLVTGAVAAAIGGPSYHEWRVPVGLVSDEVASDCLESVAQVSGCLQLRGANLSAFEVYGAAIRDIVVQRQFGAASLGRLALLASWAHGPAAFPDGGTLAELGPVFATDTLPMRGMSAKLPPLQFGRLARDSWMQVEGLEFDALVPVANELGELLREAGFEGGSLWRRTAIRAYAILRAMPGGSPEADLGSIMISWAIPWANATGGPAEEIARLAERDSAVQMAEEQV